MKVVILAGGYGTRIAEESGSRPKPMVEIGGKPILWHIMKIYSAYGFNEFIICLGYKGYVIKEYFQNFYLHHSDLTIDLKSNTKVIHNNVSENWKVTLVDTGEETLTGGRIKRIQHFVGEETFLLTYGDGVGNINILEAIKFHKENKKLCTLTCARPAGRFGIVEIEENNTVSSFREKRPQDVGWINAGFFVCESKVFDYISEGDASIWEKSPLETLANDNELLAYKHLGFWKPMDTMKDKIDLNELWLSDKAEWKIW